MHKQHYSLWLTLGILNPGVVVVESGILRLSTNIFAKDFNATSKSNLTFIKRLQVVHTIIVVLEVVNNDILLTFELFELRLVLVFLEQCEQSILVSGGNNFTESRLHILS